MTYLPFLPSRLQPSFSYSRGVPQSVLECLIRRMSRVHEASISVQVIYEVLRHSDLNDGMVKLVHGSAWNTLCISPMGSIV